MDVLIFMGQSNMQGSTGEKCDFPLDENLFEYRYLTDEIVPLTSPVGETIGEEVLGAATLGNGSLVPFFCKAYAEKRKGKVLAIHTARSGTNIDEWKSGEERFNVAVAKIKAGLNKANEMEKTERVAVVWLQGESDALRYLPKKDYAEKLTAFKNALKEEFNFDKFGIIKTGYFAAYSGWVEGTFEEKKAADEEIMAAQEEVAKEDTDFTVLTDVTKKLSVDDRYLNPKEGGPHYNNAGMQIIGEAAGAALAKKIGVLNAKN